MSSAIIQIRSSDENFYIYRSSDGYPECCGLEFNSVINKYRDNKNAKQIATDLACHPNFEAVACERGNERYKYVFDCVTGIIKILVKQVDEWVNISGRY